jgi:hypothetical protein
LIPLYCFELCEAVTRHREVHHVGAGQPVVHDGGALAPHAVDEGLRQRRGRQPHVARDANPPRAEVRHESTADEVRRRFVDLGRIEPTHVVGFEDGRIDAHSLL